MTELGTVREIFRYPVKSMMGESLPSSTVGIDGIPGDRAWGVRDEARGDFFLGKRSAALMACQASYPDASALSSVVPEIRLPDGTHFSADSDGAAKHMGNLVGREVTLWPVVPAAREATPGEDVDVAAEMKQMMARTEDEPFPDFSNPPPELIEVYARGGPFFDAFPISLMTQRSIESIAAAAPESVVDVRRFRPSVLIDPAKSADSGNAFPEQDWIGRRVKIGSAVFSIPMTIVRCIMTTHGFSDLPKDPRVMRTLVKEAEGNLGVYGAVDEPGEIRCGDPVVLLD